MCQVEDSIHHIFYECPKYSRSRKALLDFQRRIGALTRYPALLQRKGNPNIPRKCDNIISFLEEIMKYHIVYNVIFTKY
ncbi:hypothetical protein CHS0354_024597 [Potamilus streckersoni]|uniref:Uncharacterized protein n=1 Tax=Potamilus streckersoni TaxID=2493646 RepID=A0AAE0SF87_9BIVA|nr:hypothetical protein CHS0354_024597 [Potamilus streckersoni]